MELGSTPRLFMGPRRCTSVRGASARGERPHIFLDPRIEVLHGTPMPVENERGRRWLAMVPASTRVQVTAPFSAETTTHIPLPEGADVMLFAFKTKKAARAWFGRRVELLEVTVKPLQAGR